MADRAQGDICYGTPVPGDLCVGLSFGSAMTDAINAIRSGHARSPKAHNQAERC